MQLYRIFGVAALTLVAGLAQAVPVTFSFDSTITTNYPPVDPARTVGSPLSVSVTFDSDANFIRTRLDSGGNPLRHEFDPSSIFFTINGGGLTESLSATGGGFFYVRDNMPNPDCGTGNAFTNLCGPVDGLTFVANSWSADGLTLTSWSLILRGTTLDLITGPVLPTYQDDRWDNLEIAQFSASVCVSSSAGSDIAGTCDVSLTGFDSTIRAVPEPGTLGLLGLGLAGLGFARRRKTA